MDIRHRTVGLLEAPLPQDDGSVLFSNVTEGGVYRLAGDAVETVLPDRRGIGGLALHECGSLIVSGRDLSIVGGGSIRKLLSPNGSTGINDFTVAPDGSIVAGVLRHRPAKGEPVVPSEILHFRESGAVTPLAVDILWPNGIGLSPDGDTLYVAEYAASRIRAISGGSSTIFAAAPRGACDGLAVDVDGGVWVALGSGGGIARFAPDGTLRETIDVPAEFVSSVAFAGTTLWVTTAGALFSFDAGVEGLPIPAATVALYG